ncbi:hypothetical protein ACFSKI_19070 [Pseudogracilibacillus auburnensis]|uniref:Phage-related protein n=1 Tax=Pseudogracilibacillus auburnensis TaxID=1494959 RepID=A0A2V3W6N0_9BACI|nr:hypothetical protein [Pseudogracilibacillus auburnensis]PXW88798.1 hypothetical protein DFR56_103304 [Pseudogracilibacillus auburnensis]
MIKDALKYLVGMGKAEIHKENDQTFSDKQLHLIKKPTAGPFVVNTLSGLVDYLQSDFDEKYNSDNPFIVHIVSPTEVKVESPLNNDAGRDYFVKAEALIPHFLFDSFHDTEEFNIKLQSCFVKNEDRDIMLKVVGNIQEDNVKNVKDDGISQAVVAKVGVASVGNVEVPNPVSLAPFRSFVEVDQPVSDFVFRMQNGPRCALFESDGGAWKLEAISNIKTYLHLNLTEEIEKGEITIIA